MTLSIVSLKNQIFGPVTVAVDAGQSLIVAGVSGSGKTRFLRAVADLDEAEGDILLNGCSFRSQPAYDWRRQVRFVPATSGWWFEIVRPHFTVSDDLYEAMDILELRRELLDSQLRDISTGEQQRLSFLRSIQNKPAVLLLDEPTSALDLRSISGVEALIDRELKRGAIILLASHSAEQVEKYGQQQLVFQVGGSTYLTDRRDVSEVGAV